MDEQVNAVGILSSLNTVSTVQETVKKEIRKINYFASQVQQFISERDFTKLQRLCETTLPGKLSLMEDLIERMVEVMIDEEGSDEEIKKWSAETRENIQDALKLLEHGKQLLTRYHQEQADMAQAKLKEEEQKKLDEIRKEQRDYKEKMHQEKISEEREAWREQQEIMLETKMKELELFKSAQKKNVKLPEFNITPFQGTCKDWIRFSNQFCSQIRNQPVSKVVKFGYLLQLIKGASHDLIGNIPNTDEGYERALMILKDQFGQDKSVIAAHTKEIIDLSTVYGTRYSKVKEFYDKLSVNYEALRAMKAYTKVEGLVLATLEKIAQIKPDITRNDEQLESWGFDELFTELRKWLKRNYSSKESGVVSDPNLMKKSKSFLATAQTKPKPRCFFCPKQHWPDQCDVIVEN